MTDQLQAAIQITQDRITALEGELRRGREFMLRMVPNSEPAKRRVSHGSSWREVFTAISSKPMRHEHIIDFIDEHKLTMTRGATRAWLNDKTKRGYLKRDKAGFYTVTPAGQEWLKASSS